MSNSKHRLVPLTMPNIEETDGFPLYECNYCDDKDGNRPKSVIAKEHLGKIHRFFGMCGNHAEMSGLSEQWSEVR